MDGLTHDYFQHDVHIGIPLSLEPYEDIHDIQERTTTKSPNYRGINVISVIPKLYDMVLSNRFALWYVPKCGILNRVSSGCNYQHR